MIQKDDAPDREGDGTAYSQDKSRQFELLVQSVVDYAIFMLDPEGRAMTWNKGAEQLFGYPEAEAIGKPLSTFYDPADAEAGKPEQLLQAALAAGHIEAESWAVRKDGSRFWADAVITATRDAQGRLVGFGKVTRDLTTHRAAEEDLRRSYERLKELDTLKDHFLSTVSHEMKTPLSLIMGYAELLQDKYPQEPFLAGIHEGSIRLMEHLNKMLDYSALLSGSLPLYKTEVNLGEAVENAREILEADQDFHLKHLHLQVEVDPGVPAIQGDFRRITQMLLELLDNAKKFTPEEGNIKIHVSQEGSEVQIEVCDTGRGIPDSEIARIWQPFAQVEAGKAAQKGGMGLGLGLTITKELAELHRGRITVSSRLGAGSCFSIMLPISTIDSPEK